MVGLKSCPVALHWALSDTRANEGEQKGPPILNIFNVFPKGSGPKMKIFELRRLIFEHFRVQARK